MTQTEKKTLKSICDDLLETLHPNLSSETADKIVAKAIGEIYLTFLGERIDIVVNNTGFVCCYDQKNSRAVYNVEIVKK